MKDILDRADEFRKAAAKLEIPVLLVRAGRGTATDDADVERLAALVPHLQVETVPDSGHLVAREAPDALATLLQAFVRSEEVRDRRSPVVG